MRSVREYRVAYNAEPLLDIAEAMAQPRILDVLGVPASASSLRKMVLAGLPKAALLNTTRRLATVLSPEEVMRLTHSIVPKATLARRRDTLTPEESERTARLARVIAQAEDIWAPDIPEAHRFLVTPHALLAQETPLSVAMSEVGAREVEELLDSLQYGLAL